MRKRLIIATLMAVTLSAISALAQTTLHTVRLAQAVLGDGEVSWFRVDGVIGNQLEGRPIF